MTQELKAQFVVGRMVTDSPCSECFTNVGYDHRDGCKLAGGVS